ncbi:uncharacterized protein MELLADRAFT_57798 [Melampsora larici-populina 98AG31]|uniref:Uncharacterized protein n=1 Tax=Melampsora larici-populina (strain 98AG31 / pathotype 3-4-7) TaxID=747676 RepID=F4S6V0_MELLP|nr:uncharacterized protein MELLADRAFT_57798 [Melampsora larici-populina 98AG31]EGF99661.1 hypothetical protein MELLADRAFT_57798 [Melampsora larici-populina 98AG31]
MSFSQRTREIFSSARFQRTLFCYFPATYFTIVFMMYGTYKIIFGHQIPEIFFIRFLAQHLWLILAWSYLIAQTVYSTFDPSAKKKSYVKVEKDIEKAEKGIEFVEKDIQLGQPESAPAPYLLVTKFHVCEIYFTKHPSTIIC